MSRALTALPEQLEAAIRAAPDDRANYLVAADWLQQRGDPHGELIAVSCAAADLRADDPAGRHVELAGHVARLQRQVEPVLAGRHRQMQIEWRWGFIAGLAFISTQDHDEHVLLQTVLQSPRARFLRSLVLSEIANRKLLTAVMTEASALRCVRSLMILANNRAARSFELESLWPQLEQLEQLVLDLPGTGSALSLPALVELSLTVRGRGVEILRDARLPALQTLRVQLRDEASLPCEWIAPERFPALRRLSLSSRDTLEPLWSRSAIAGQLELLDLTGVWQAGNATARTFVVDRRSSTPPPEAGLLAIDNRSSARGTLIVLPETGTFSIGQSDISSEMLGASPYTYDHARLQRTPRGWEVEQSSGAALNRQPVPSGALRSMDELVVGARTFRFVEGDIDRLANELRTRFALSGTERISGVTRS